LEGQNFYVKKKDENNKTFSSEWLVYFNNTYPDTLLWFTPNCHQDIDI